MEIVDNITIDEIAVLLGRKDIAIHQLMKENERLKQELEAKKKPEKK